MSVIPSEYMDICQTIEQNYAKICSIWDEIGSYNEEARKEMKKQFLSSCKESLMIAINNTFEREKQVGWSSYFLIL
jgi:hypothetical protein